MRRRSLLSSMNNFALEARNLRFRYLEQNKKNVLENISARFEKGKITVLMGGSGCGKSTLAALLAGLYPENGGIITDGERFLLGKPIEDYSVSERACSLSMMFQNADLQFCMDTPRKEMLFCLGNISCPPEQMKNRIDTAAEKLCITALLDRPLHSLSGGEKQKIALCCIFLLGSEVILLDEPFANIDEKWAKEIAEMLKEMNREKETTVIVIDHSLDHWLDCAHEIQVMKKTDGSILRIPRAELKNHRELFREEGLRWPFEEAARELCNESGESPVITLDNVSYCIEKKRKKESELLLKDAKAVFYKNKMTAIVGPSGCGKTTLFRVLLGQNKYNGSIKINGKELKDLRSRELFQRVGIVFQNPSNQFLTQNVLEEVECGLAGRIVKKNEFAGTETEQKAIELLKEFGLDKFRKYSPYMLSQGQQRRLAVLSVLAGQQKILLLDEPTYGQDDAMTQEIMKLLRRKTDTDDLTVIFSTHDKRLVKQWADHCYEFTEGGLVYADHGKAESAL